MNKTDLDQVFDLGLSEKLQLVEDLWDSIAAVPEQVPVPDWQKDELRRRKEYHSKNPGLGVSWGEAKKRIRTRRG